MGASIASVIAELTVTVCQFIFISKYGELKISKILASSWRYIISSIVLALFYYAVISLLSCDGLISIVILVIVGIAIYVLALILLRDPGVMYYIRRKKQR